MGAVAAAAGGYYLYTNSQGSLATATTTDNKGTSEDKSAAASASSAAQSPPKTFVGGDQGFIDLQLSEVTNVNHNVKKLRFELPDKDAVSGLHVACKSDCFFPNQKLQLAIAAFRYSIH